MKKTFIKPETATKTANAKATKTAKHATKTEKTAKAETKPAKTEAADTKAETAPKTVELPDPAKMTKDDYKKVSRKMRRLCRAGKTEEAAKLAKIVETAKKNLGIGAKAEKTEKPVTKTEKATKADKAPKTEKPVEA